MTVFNAWYYSFSPGVAGFVTQHEEFRSLMKYVLYPLLAIMKIGSITFTLMQTSPETAAVVSGLVVTWLLGASYIAFPLSFLLMTASRARRVARRLERPLMVVLLGAIGVVFVAEATGEMLGLMFLTSTAVLTVMMLSALLTSRLLTSLYSILDRRRFA